LVRTGPHAEDGQKGAQFSTAGAEVRKARNGNGTIAESPVQLPVEGAEKPRPNGRPEESWQLPAPGPEV